MAWLFGRNRKPPRKTPGRKSLTTDEQERKLKLKERQFQHDEYMKMLRESPELKRQAVAEAFHLDLKVLDPTEQRKQEITSKITELALKKIDEDPELAERFAKVEIERIIGAAETFVEGLEGEASSPARQLLEQMEDLDEIKRKFGGGGLISNLLNPETIQSFFEVLPTLINKNLTQTRYVIEKGNEVVEMDTAGYKQYLEEKARKRLTVAPEEVTRVEEKVEEPKVEPEAVKAKETISLNISAWLPYLDEVPEQFVSDMSMLAEGEDEEQAKQAQFVLNLLREKSADEIIELLQPFKENPEFKEAIEKLEERQYWLEGVINLLSEGEGEQSDLFG